MSQLILLGPQHHEIYLKGVVEELGLKGSLAVITAGWQERESEVEELDAHLGQKTINLMLHRRSESIFEEDKAFREAHRVHMFRVKRLQDIYRERLTHYLDAVRQLHNRSGKLADDLLLPELENAYEVVRQLDQQHLGRITDLHREFHSDWPIEKRPVIRDHFFELDETLNSCAGVLIAGGHVAVLLNRLRLLNLVPMLREKTVIAWGAGAMCLGSQVVLFHDSPPQGKGYSETFEAGLGLFSGILPLPHADQRLMLNDADRVARFARRFNNNKCLTLVRGSRIEFKTGVLQRTHGVRILGQNGLLEEVK